MMKKHTLTVLTLLTFTVSLTVCLALTGASVYYKLDAERNHMESLILEKANLITQIIPRLMYKTDVLEALVLKGDGEITDFAATSETLIDDSPVLSLMLAPDGVVTEVYPLEGNEAVLGIDLFAPETNGSKETEAARETGKFILSGPIDVIQGGQALAGRHPVYITEADGSRRFWGIVSATLRHPDALEGAELSMLENLGYGYELWRINPDNGEKQIISASEKTEQRSGAGYIERRLSVHDTDWYLRLFPERAWYEYPSTWVLAGIALIISLLITLLTQALFKLRRLKTQLEGMAYSDSLTGLFNHRYFMEYAPAETERAIRLGEPSYLILFDLDDFKQINDERGHTIGDAVLKAVAAVAGSAVRPYDVLARLGGDEFCVFVSNVTQELAEAIARRMASAIAETRFNFGGLPLTLTASFGIAPVTMTATGAAAETGDAAETDDATDPSDDLLAGLLADLSIDLPSEIETDFTSGAFDIDSCDEIYSKFSLDDASTDCLEAALVNADKAMYCAKKHGHGRIAIYDGDRPRPLAP